MFFFLSSAHFWETKIASMEVGALPPSGAAWRRISIWGLGFAFVIVTTLFLSDNLGREPNSEPAAPMALFAFDPGVNSGSLSGRGKFDARAERAELRRVVNFGAALKQLRTQLRVKKPLTVGEEMREGLAEIEAAYSRNDTVGNNTSVFEDNTEAITQTNVSVPAAAGAGTSGKKVGSDEVGSERQMVANGTGTARPAAVGVGEEDVEEKEGRGNETQGGTEVSKGTKKAPVDVAKEDVATEEGKVGEDAERFRKLVVATEHQIKANKIVAEKKLQAAHRLRTALGKAETAIQGAERDLRVAFNDTSSDTVPALPPSTTPPPPPPQVPSSTPPKNTAAGKKIADPEEFIAAFKKWMAALPVKRKEAEDLVNETLNTSFQASTSDELGETTNATGAEPVQTSGANETVQAGAGDAENTTVAAANATAFRSDQEVSMQGADAGANESIAAGNASEVVEGPDSTANQSIAAGNTSEVVEGSDSTANESIAAGNTSEAVTSTVSDDGLETGASDGKTLQGSVDHNQAADHWKLMKRGFWTASPEVVDWHKEAARMAESNSATAAAEAAIAAAGQHSHYGSLSNTSEWNRIQADFKAKAAAARRPVPPPRVRERLHFGANDFKAKAAAASARLSRGLATPGSPTVAITLPTRPPSAFAPRSRSARQGVHWPTPLTRLKWRERPGLTAAGGRDGERLARTMSLASIPVPNGGIGSRSQTSRGMKQLPALSPLHLQPKMRLASRPDTRQRFVLGARARGKAGDRGVTRQALAAAVQGLSAAGEEPATTAAEQYL